MVAKLLCLPLSIIVMSSSALGQTICDEPRGGQISVSAPTHPPVGEFSTSTLSFSVITSGPKFEFDPTATLVAGQIVIRLHRAAIKEFVPPDGGVPPAPPTQSVVMPGFPPGTYTVRFEDGLGRSAGCGRLMVTATGTKVRAQTLVYGDLLRYFLTTSQSDVDALLTQTPNRSEWSFAAWQTTDAGFNVWPATGAAPDAAKAVCRLFNTRASSHFYSANATDCATLAAQPDWRNEGTAFRALVPEGGVCGFGTDPVYRLFNTQRSNHRYTPSAETYRTLVGNNGWVGEGVAFCSPQASG